MDYCYAGHMSAEPGHKHVLEYLKLKPLVRMDMRLEEGTGASIPSGTHDIRKPANQRESIFFLVVYIIFIYAIVTT